MKHSREYEQFERTMVAILRADPQQVKAEMERESRHNAEERKARGERKRGKKKATKKQPSSSFHASSGKEP